MTGLSVPGALDGRTVRRFVLDIDERLERLDRAIVVADWNQFTGKRGTPPEEWHLRRARLLATPGLLDWVGRARSTRVDRGIARRVELLSRILLDAQVEQRPEVVRLRGELSRRIIAFRPRWNGRRVERQVLHRALHRNPRRTNRRRAFYAYDELNTRLEPELHRLVDLRNEGARQFGFRNFFEMRLSFSGVTPARMRELVDAVVEPSRRQIRGLKESFQETDAETGWYPWDFPYAREKGRKLPERSFPRSQMMSRVFDAIEQWGFRPRAMRFRIAFHDIPAGGMTLSPKPPTDVRIVVHRSGGWNSYMVMFHEVGHAVHSASMRAPPHLLHWSENVPGFGAFHEGIAELFGEIPNVPSWLVTQPGVDARSATEFARRAKSTGAVDTGHHATWIRLEQLLYERPGRDPRPDAQRFERRIFGYDPHKPASFVDDFFVEMPAYIPNYLLAILFSHQLRQTMRERFCEPYWPNPRVGPWLSRHWFAEGSTFDWTSRLEEVTGRPLGPEAFWASFGRAR